MTNATVITNLTSRPYKDAVRIQQSVLSGIEKRTLVWMAHRLPDAINADHLTLLGLASMIAAGFAYAAAAVWAPALLVVNVLLAVNWFGDSMDGTVARVRNKLRPRYGYYVDHVVDALSALFLFGGLAASGYMHTMVAMAMLLGYLLLAINSYLAAHSLGVFSISWWKFSPTEMRILLAIGNIVAFLKPHVRLGGREFLFFDVAGSIAVLCMATVLLSSVMRNTATLYREERLQ